LNFIRPVLRPYAAYQQGLEQNRLEQNRLELKRHSVFNTNSREKG